MNNDALITYLYFIDRIINFLEPMFNETLVLGFENTDPG